MQKKYGANDLSDKANRSMSCSLSIHRENMTDKTINLGEVPFLSFDGRDSRSPLNMEDSVDKDYRKEKEEPKIRSAVLIAKSPKTPKTKRNSEENHFTFRNPNIDISKREANDKNN